MKSESVHALARGAGATSSRSLSTARAVLRVLSMLAEQPTGVRADEVAHELGKSTSTAYYLLTSLCEEGFAVHESKGLYRPAKGLEQLTAAAEQARSSPRRSDGDRREAVRPHPAPFISRRAASRADRDRGVPRPSGGTDDAGAWE